MDRLALEGFSEIRDLTLFNELNKKLCGMCEKHYKSYLNDTSNKEECRQVLKKTFNLWDSFVNKLDKSDYREQLYIDLFTKHSFKNQFFSNQKMKDLLGEF